MARRARSAPISQKKDAAAQEAFIKNFTGLVNQALPVSAAGKPLEVWFLDEARVGQTPELNSMENVWHYLRANKLSLLVWHSYEAIVAACKAAWDFLISDPERIRSIGTRAWACVNT